MSEARRIWALIRLEAGYLVNRPAFWIWIGLLSILPIAVATGGSTPFLKAGDSAAGGVRPWVTSEIPISTILIINNVIFSTFFACVLAGLSPIRDEEARVSEILDATPLTTPEYVWGKFGGIVLTCLLVQAAQVVVMIVLYHLVPNPSADTWRGPFDLINYLHPLAAFVLPYLLLLTGVSYGVGAATRQPILVFVLPFGILTSFTLLLGLSEGTTSHFVYTLLPYIEPSGMRWVQQIYLDNDRGVAFYNHARIALPPGLVLSRLIEAGIGLLAVVAAQVRRTRASRNSLLYHRPRPAPAAIGETSPSPYLPGRASATTAPLAALGMRARRPGIVTAAMTIARNELRELCRQPGLYLFVPIIVYICSLSEDTDAGMFSTHRIATSGYLATSQMTSLAIFSSLLLLAYTVETLERDRSSRLAALEHALPVRTASLLLGKFLALCVVALVPMIAVAIVLLISIAHQGIGAASPGPFLLLWGGLLLPGLIAWILLLMALYALTGHNRYGTYSLGSIVLVFLTVGSDKMNWTSNLFLLDALRWSDLAPLEMDRSALILSRALALASALFWGALALYAFRRREPDAARFLGRLRPGIQVRSLLPLAPFAALAIALSIWLYHDIQQGQAGHARAEKEKDYWRRNLATWKDAALPGVADAKVALDLHPERRSFTAQGTLTLVNFHHEALLKLPITPDPGWKDVRWSLNGSPVAPEDRAGLCVFTPPGGAILPGQTVRLGFSYTSPDPGPTENGVGNAGDETWEFVLPSAVVLNSFSHSFVPQIGYDENMGIDEDNRYDADDETALNPHKGDRLPLFGSATPFGLRLSVTAPRDFLLNGVGERVSETTQGDRRTTVWQSILRPDAPVRQFNMVGGRDLAVYRGSNGTAIYYLPAHKYNVPEMSRALDAARKWYGQWFAPYPWKELKLTEFPDMAGYAQSFPTNISFGEGMGFLTRSAATDKDGRENGSEATDAFAVTAHEAAHQWWGNLVVPGKGAGSNVLSEGLAHFSAAMLLEKEKGMKARQDFLRTIEQEYNRTRSVDSELPLARMTGDKKGDFAVTYDRGGWVFTMLSERVMGRDRMLRGLQAYVAKYRASATHPTIADFLATLRPFAPDPTAFDAFTTQWFYQVTLPEFQITDARRTLPAATKANPHPQWIVTCRLSNIGSGRESVPLMLKTSDNSKYHMATVLLDSNAKPLTATFFTNFKPDRIVIDPYVTILQRNRAAAVTSL